MIEIPLVDFRNDAERAKAGDVAATLMIDDKIRKLYEDFRVLAAKLDVYNYDNPSKNPKIKINQDKIKKMHKRILKILSEVNLQDLAETWQLSCIVLNYCTDIKGCRDADFEKELINNSELAIQYAESVVSETDRWEEYENKLIDLAKVDHDPAIIHMTEYATTLNSRWEIYEKLLLEKPKIYDKKELARIIVSYCKKHSFRWKEAEPFVLKDAGFSVEYAVEVIKNRWIEAEPIIIKNLNASTNYLSNFKFSWPEYERKINNNCKRILSYAKDIVCGKLPDELHNRMIMYGLNPEDSVEKVCSEQYLEFLKNCEEITTLFLKSISKEERKKIWSKITA